MVNHACHVALEHTMLWPLDGTTTSKHGLIGIMKVSLGIFVVLMARNGMKCLFHCSSSFGLKRVKVC
jgi:hypothetical protein